ncbi:MAG: phosphoenolpyruvate--protein phosphotransferase [Verrucomicrobia bacterium]|nr:phosphoenolpyruvate--protein phosphotransferase [Verrucomicrobiota bacterium]
MPEPAQAGQRTFRGVPVSNGICRGRVLVLGRPQGTIARRHVGDDDVPRELERFEQALITTRHQLHELQQQVMQKLGAKDALIFDAHLMMLDDPTLIEEVTRRIRDEKLAADSAFHEASGNFIETLAAVDDEYLRERVADLRDVAARVLGNLTGGHETPDIRRLKEPCIIVSHDLAPSTTAVLDKKNVLGFATDAGGRTSHTAIMARSMQIPAVVGLQTISRDLEDGAYVLLDGFNGVVIVNPTDQTLFEYGQLVRAQEGLREKLRDVLDKPAVTLDGTRVVLAANIGQAGETDSIRANGAEGAGLFRTEFLFINRERLPGEEEQFEAYRAAAAAVKPAPLILRTLDLGGDKFLAQQEQLQELNPFLGWRAIRYCLHEQDVFRQQLRAILRAGAEGNVKMMFPMISGLDELTQALAIVEQCKAELHAEAKPFDERLEVGVMIEIPAAVMVADALARRVKFFSIGTNDLIQYSLAVDRINERVAHLYEPTNPAILRLIKMTVDAGRRNGIWTGVCGEMAGEPALVPILLGLGVEELSVSASLVPQTKFLIRRLKMPEARALAEFSLQCESGAEILARANELVRQVAPSLFEGRP